MKKAQNQRHTIRFSIIVGVVLLCAVVIAVPFFSANREEKNFQSLSNAMRSTFTSLQAVDTSSSWRFSESCQDIYSGSFPTGEITCSIELSLQKSVNSATAVKKLHESYYRVIANDAALLPASQLSLTPSRSFGKEFVVSVAEARYTVKDLPDIACRYNLSLGQTNENSSNFSLGSKIDTKSGTVRIAFLCTGAAQGYWYPKI